MAPSYQHLAVTVLRTDPMVPMEREYHVMHFPGRWKQPLRELAQASQGRDAVRIPVADLNSAIAALVPDCVTTMKYVGKGDGDEEWLLAYQEINKVAIFSLVAAWVRAQKATIVQIQRTLEQLQSDHLSWSTLSINLSAPDQRGRALLPLEIAATLSRRDEVCPHDNLSFRRCATDEGAELISWPPTCIQEQTPYSVKIDIKTQTIPTSDELLVYLRFGLRRWMPERGTLSFEHGHTVYMAPTVPYLSGLENSRHFCRARIKLAHLKNADGSRAYQPRWDDGLAQVLAEAGCLSRLPDPQQLTDKPMDFLQEEDEAAALVYGTGMLRWEKVSAGLSPTDREPLMAWAAKTLIPHLRLAEPLQRQKTTVYKGLGGIVEGAIPAEKIVSVVGGHLDIELFTDTTRATMYALERLGTRLGFELPHPDQLTDQRILIQAGPLVIGLRRPATSEICADLDRSAQASRKPQAAVEARVDLIQERLGNASHPTICLVEIASADTYQGLRRGDDPKFAIRHGLLLTGRLSQFITPVVEPKRPRLPRPGKEPSDPNQERFNSSIDELFRQLGIRAQPLPAPTAGTLDRPPALLAIWMIRQNKARVWGVTRQVPVAVLIDPSGEHIEVRAPGVNWQPLHTGLLAIGAKHVNVEGKFSPEDTVRFLKETITEATDGYPDVLLLTHAQNLRSAWPSIANNHIQLDTLGLRAGSPQPIAELPGMRHVRIRTDENGETPQCYGVTDTETGQPQGLWNFLLPRLFGSTSGKPASASGAIKGISKFLPGEHNGKQTAPKPKAQVWNAQFIEIFVAAIQSGDQAEHWAALTHDLRNAAPYSKPTTIQPWPLHLAEQIEEYLLPTKINVTGEGTPAAG